ncbi:MAG TPA: hypothetical protein VN253_13265 [Kofleriaceae bacterium]|nr:hypothetical protein [Kofleriaceae bacterium]
MATPATGAPEKLDTFGGVLHPTNGAAPAGGIAGAVVDGGDDIITVGAAGGALTGDGVGGLA